MELNDDYYKFSFNMLNKIPRKPMDSSIIADKQMQIKLTNMIGMDKDY